MKRKGVNLDRIMSVAQPKTAQPVVTTPLGGDGDSSVMTIK